MEGVKLAKFGMLLDELRDEHERVLRRVRALVAENACLEKLCQTSSPSPRRIEPAGPAEPSRSTTDEAQQNGTEILCDDIDLLAGSDLFASSASSPVPAPNLSNTEGIPQFDYGQTGTVESTDRSSMATQVTMLSTPVPGRTSRASKATQNSLIHLSRTERRSQAAAILSKFSSTVTLEPHHRHRAYTKHLDLIMCLIIVANSIVMAVAGEWSGHNAGVNLDLIDPHRGWDHAEITFDILEYIFTAIFCAELAYRIWSQGRMYFYALSNNFDAGVVVISVLCIIIENSKGKWNLLRSLRVLKVGRMLRVCRIVHLLGSFRLVVATMRSAVGACFWPISVLFLFVISAGILLCSILLDAIEDESIEIESRIWTYKLYGTSSRAAYTMFEATFSGCWPNYARRMIDELSAMYACFWVPYVTIVVFAIVRIISALFIKDIMQRASADGEILQLEREKMQAAYMDALDEAFQAMDISGDAVVDREEMSTVMNDPKVIANLEALGLHDFVDNDIFGILDNGDGEVTYQDFKKGVMRMRGPARSIDLVEVLLEGRKLKKLLDQVVQGLEKGGGNGLVLKNCKGTSSFDRSHSPEDVPTHRFLKSI